MKKVLIAAAVAASMTGGVAQATTWIAASNLATLPGTELWFGGVDLLSSVCSGSVPGIAIGGTVDDIGGTADTVVNSALTLNGQLAFDANCGGGPLLVLVNIHLDTGVAGATGVTFNGGVVDVWVQTSMTTTFAAFGTVSASSTSIPCVNSASPSDGIAITAGMALNTPPVATVITLPGGSMSANPTCEIDLTAIFGGVASLYLTGTMGLIP